MTDLKFQTLECKNYSDIKTITELFVSFELSSVRNLNKILKNFYNKGDFYSCSYNKSYSDGYKGLKQGFTNNPKEIVKTKFFTDYQIFDEIILVLHQKQSRGYFLNQSKDGIIRQNLSLKDLKEKLLSFR